MRIYDNDDDDDDVIVDILCTAIESQFAWLYCKYIGFGYIAWDYCNLCCCHMLCAHNCEIVNFTVITDIEHTDNTYCN